MKKAILPLLALSLTACETITHSSGIEQHLDTVCLRGVVYYFYDGYKKMAMSPAYNQDGSLILCINEEELKAEINGNFN